MLRLSLLALCLSGCAPQTVYRNVDLSCSWLAPLEFSDHAIEAMNLDDLYRLNSFNETVVKNCPGWVEK